MTAKKPENQKKKRGRHLKFNTLEDFKKGADSYFSKCKSSKRIPTISGLCLFLNIHLDTLNEYQKKPEFSATIKSAKLLIMDEWAYELNRRSGQVAGIIFYLKNAFKENFRDNYGMTGEDGGSVNVNLAEFKDKIASKLKVNEPNSIGPSETPKG